MSKLGGSAITRIFGKLVDTTDHGSETDKGAPAVADATRPETEIERNVSQLNGLMAVKVRLQGLRAQEIDKKESLDQQVHDLDAQRIEALTAHRIDGDEESKQRAEDLFGQIEQLKQNARDVTAVAGAIDVKIIALGEQIKAAEGAYRINLGKFFDDQMDNLVAEYNDLAPKFARMITDIDALYRVMIQYGTGNSNGWWRDARVPTIRPRDGRIYPAIVDTTSSGFEDTARRRAAEMIESIRSGRFCVAPWKDARSVSDERE